MLRSGLIVVLAAAVAWTFAGCDRFQSKNVDPRPNRYEDMQAKAREAESRPAPTNDRSASGGATAERPPEPPVTGEASTPRKCYELYRQAIKNRDFDACWALLSGTSKDAYETAASDLKTRVTNTVNPSDPDREVLGVLGLTPREADKLTGRMFMAGSMQRQVAKDSEALDEITRTEYDHESIYGAKARVYVKIRGQRQPEAMNLIREGGLWHIETRPQRPTN